MQATYILKKRTNNRDSIHLYKAYLWLLLPQWSRDPEPAKIQKSYPHRCQNVSLSSAQNCLEKTCWKGLSTWYHGHHGHDHPYRQAIQVSDTRKLIQKAFSTPVQIRTASQNPAGSSSTVESAVMEKFTENLVWNSPRDPRWTNFVVFYRVNVWKHFLLIFVRVEGTPGESIWWIFNHCGSDVIIQIYVTAWKPCTRSVQREVCVFTERCATSPCTCKWILVCVCLQGILIETAHLSAFLHNQHMSWYQQ